MGRRKKVLKRRLYTYEQLDSRMVKADKAGLHGAPLYGSIKVEYMPGRMNAGLRIRWVGKSASFTLAAVFRTRDGTLYEVHGIGALRNKPSVREFIDLWTRYIPAFTPHDPSRRLYEGDRAHYLLRDGEVTETDDSVGIWKTMPRCMVPKREKWAAGGSYYNFGNLQNFPRRCRLFATRLRKSLEEDNLGVVQLRNHTDWPSSWRAPMGNALHVCTPPTDRQNGRRLVVLIAMHEAESRRFHHVDGDHAIKHCQFWAIEEGKTYTSALRWKCSRDAINGIREWIFGDIYIPGPG